MGHSVHRRIRVGLVILAMALSVAVLPRVTARVLPRADGTVREIRMNVRDMTYFLEGIPEPNPTLRVSAGQRVRIILSNDDAGMSHDLQIPSWTVGTRLLKGRGSDTIDFTAPAARGTYSYKCTPHSEMMQGTIEVE
jgi:plastocyanin